MLTFVYKNLHTHLFFISMQGDIMASFKSFFIAVLLVTLSSSCIHVTQAGRHLLPDLPAPRPRLPGVPLPRLPGVPLPPLPGVPLPRLPGVPLPPLPGIPIPRLPLPFVPPVTIPSIPSLPTITIPHVPGVPPMGLI